MRRNIFYFTFQSNQFERNMKKKSFSMCNLLKFSVLTSKLLLQKESLVTICENSPKKSNVIIEIFSCDLDDHKSFKMDPIPRLYQQYF